MAGGRLATSEISAKGGLQTLVPGRVSKAWLRPLNEPANVRVVTADHIQTTCNDEQPIRERIVQDQDQKDRGCRSQYGAERDDPRDSNRNREDC